MKTHQKSVLMQMHEHFEYFGPLCAFPFQEFKFQPKLMNEWNENERQIRINKPKKKYPEKIVFSSTSAIKIFGIRKSIFYLRLRPVYVHIHCMWVFLIWTLYFISRFVRIFLQIIIENLQSTINHNIFRLSSSFIIFQLFIICISLRWIIVAFKAFQDICHIN